MPFGLLSPCVDLGEKGSDVPGVYPSFDTRLSRWHVVLDYNERWLIQSNCRVMEPHRLENNNIL